MKALRVISALFLAAMCQVSLAAQDPVKVDASHYKVLADNASVRVLKISYPAGAKSTMHQHPENIVIALDAAAIDRDRLGRGQADRLPGGQIEAGSVHVALDLAIADISFRERDLGMRAFVRGRVEAAVTVYDRQLFAADLDWNGGLGGNVGDGANLDELACHRARS